MPDFLQYVYNDVSGFVILLPQGTVQVTLAIPGWHGPWNTREEVEAYYEANKAAHPNWQKPTYNPATGVGNTVDTAAQAATDKLTPSLDKFAPWFTRIGEVLLGLILIGVGVAKLTGTTNTIAKTVKAVIP